MAIAWADTSPTETWLLESRAWNFQDFYAGSAALSLAETTSFNASYKPALVNGVITLAENTTFNVNYKPVLSAGSVVLAETIAPPKVSYKPALSAGVITLDDTSGWLRNTSYFASGLITLAETTTFKATYKPVLIGGGIALADVANNWRISYKPQITGSGLVLADVPGTWRISYKPVLIPGVVTLSNISGTVEAILIYSGSALYVLSVDGAHVIVESWSEEQDVLSYDWTEEAA